MREKMKILITIVIATIIVLTSMWVKRGTPEVKETTQTPQQAILVPSKYVGEFHITHYCSCPKCTGTPIGSRTSTGHKPREGRTIAVDPKKIPLHSVVYIEGVGTFVAEDVGGAIKGNKLDVYVDNHEKALQLGTLGGKKFKVYILE